MNKLEKALEYIEKSARKASQSSAWGCAEAAAEIAAVEVHREENSNYPDLVRLEKDVRSALGSQVVIVARHAAAVEWLKKQGIAGPVITHATPDDVRGKDIFGVLPIWLAEHANSVNVISLPDLPPEKRGQELTVGEMEQYGACITRYIVTRA